MADSSSSSLIPLFQSVDEEERFASQFSSQTVVPGMYVDFEFLREEKFNISFSLSPYRNFLSLKIDWSLRVVRAFYPNLQFDEGTTTLTTQLREMSITLDCHTLETIFDLPTREGHQFTKKPTSVRRMLGFNLNTYIAMLMEMRELPEDFKFLPVRLLMNHKVLQSIVTHYPLNKFGNYANCNEVEIVLMYLLKEQVVFDFSFFILHQMAAITKKLNAAFPMPL